MSVPESRQGTRSQQQDGVNVSVKPHTQNDLSELPQPSDTSSAPGSMPQKSSLKTAGEKTSNAQKAGGSLLDGQFDEGESHNSFLEALNAFRGKGPEADKAEGKSVRFQGEQAASKPAPRKNNFFASIDKQESDWKVVEMPQFADGGMQSDNVSVNSQFGPKESCWQCYKLFPKHQAVVCELSQKHFCKDVCRFKYETEHFVTCQLKLDGEVGSAIGCTKMKSKAQKFLKTNGHFRLGKWFCSDECSERDDDVKHIVKMEEEKGAALAAGDLSDEIEIDL